MLKSPIHPTKNTICAVLLFLLLLSISGSLGAEIPNPIKVAFMPGLGPVSYINEDGEHDGIFPRIITEIARTNKLEIQWVEGEWGENLERTRRGEIDLMIGVIYTLERDAFLDYCREPVITSWSQVFQKEEALVNTVLDIEDLKVGLVFGDQNAAGFVHLADQFRIEYEAVYFDSFSELADALRVGDLDAGVFYSLYHTAAPDLFPTSIIYQPNNSYFAVPNGTNRDLLRLIDQTLEEWKEDKDSYYYEEVISLVTPKVEEFPQWIMILISALMFAAVLAAIFIILMRQQIKEKTKALLETQEAYKSTFMYSLIGMVHADLSGLIVRANKQFVEFLGYSEQELSRLRFPEFTFSEDNEAEKPFFEELMNGERESYTMEKRYIRKDGEIVWGKLGAYTVRDSENTIGYIVGLVEDINDQKRAEFLLGDLEHRYRGLFHNSSQATAILDELGRVIDANDTLGTLFSLPTDPKEILGRQPSELDWLGPVGSEYIQEMIDESLSTAKSIQQTVGFGEGESRKSFNVTTKPILDDSKNVRYCIVEAHDVTELANLTVNLERTVENRTAQIKEAQEQLVEAEKMAILGRLVAGIAHEINTPLGVAITGVSYLSEQIDELKRNYLEKTLSEDGLLKAIDSLDELADIMKQNLDKANKLVRDFKNTSADQSNREARVVDINEYFSAILHTLSPQLKKAEVAFEVDVPAIKECMYVGVMSQIVLNLAVNAIYHGLEGIDGGMIELVYRTDGNQRRLIFSDNGTGISSSVAENIYEPFVTTGRSKGFTGLGLNIVYNLVSEVLKGTINCEPRPGGGTTFTIDYPLPQCVSGQ